VSGKNLPFVAFFRLFNFALDSIIKCYLPTASFKAPLIPHEVLVQEPEFPGRVEIRGAKPK